MADLIVDSQLLSQCSSQLKQIDSEFKSTSTHQHALAGDWGSGDIASAMDKFADNWDYHRKKLIDSIEAVGQLVDKCNEAFTSADQKLANGVTQHK